MGRSRSGAGLPVEHAFSAGGVVIRHGHDGPELVLGLRRRDTRGEHTLESGVNLRLQDWDEDLDNGYVLERSWSATDPLLVRRSMNTSTPGSPSTQTGPKRQTSSSPTN